MSKPSDQKKKIFVIHPIFLSLCPVLSLYLHNVHEVSFGQTLLPLLWCASATALIMGALYLVFRDIYKAGIVAAVVVFPLLSYGHFPPLLMDVRPIVEGMLRITVIVVLPVILVGLIIFRLKRPPIQLTRYLNRVSLIFALGLLGTSWGSSLMAPSASVAFSQLEEIQSTSTSDRPKSSLRDIYYIILDGYANTQTLEKFYDYSNRDFIGGLEKRGFYVAKNSRSNYPHTIVSLPSSLNMDYVHKIWSRQWGGNTFENPVFVELIRNNRLLKFLKKQGYQTVHLSSGTWRATLENPYADRNFGAGKLDEFSISVLRQTIFEPFLKTIAAGAIQKNVLYAFEKLEEIPEWEEPTFTFVHFLVPHPPFVFGKDGQKLGGAEIMWQGDVWSKKQKYLDQLEFVGRKTVQMLDTLLKKSKVAPIIVLQSDHGPSLFWAGNYGNPNKMEEKEFMNAFDSRTKILNAYYLPGEGKAPLYDDITPVNSFRIILKKYFNAELDRLPDKTHFSGRWWHREKGFQKISFLR